MDDKHRKLSSYRTKRNFTHTNEPKGNRRSKGRVYVVQKHDATRLHWDLRLEHRGVLLSWAVPKEPTLDPGVKRLAIHVEDHPIEYATFEGDIPKGNYGAGHVDIWDKGTWTPEGDVDSGMEEGKLEFEIEGERLHGGFVLVRMDGDNKKENWLLIKKDDEDTAA